MESPTSKSGQIRCLSENPSKQFQFLTRLEINPFDLKDHEDEKINYQKEFIVNEIKSAENRILERCLKDMLVNKWRSLKEIYDDEFQSLVNKFNTDTIESKLTTFDTIKFKFSQRIYKELCSKKCLSV